VLTRPGGEVAAAGAVITKAKIKKTGQITKSFFRISPPPFNKKAKLPNIGNSAS